MIPRNDMRQQMEERVPILPCYSCKKMLERGFIPYKCRMNDYVCPKDEEEYVRTSS